MKALDMQKCFFFHFFFDVSTLHTPSKCLPFFDPIKICPVVISFEATLFQPTHSTSKL